MNSFNRSFIGATCIGAIGWAIGVFMSKPSDDQAKSLNAEIAALRAQLTNIRQINRMPGGAANAISAGNDSDKGITTPSASTQSLADRIAQDKARFFDEWVKRTAASNSADYDKLFADLGVSAEIAQQFKSDIAALHTQAIEAGNPMETLLRARYQFDKKLRAALSEEGYQRYRKYEEEKPATREYESLRDFAWTVKGVALDPAQADTLIHLIAAAGAATTETWHEPYDPVPRPTVGLESIVAKHRERLTLLKNASSSLFESVEQAELAEDVKQLIREYYNATIQEKQREIKFMDRPDEEVMRDVYKQEAEIMKNLPESRRPGPN